MSLDWASGIPTTSRVSFRSGIFLLPQQSSCYTKIIFRFPHDGITELVLEIQLLAVSLPESIFVGKTERSLTQWEHEHSFQVNSLNRCLHHLKTTCSLTSPVLFHYIHHAHSAITKSYITLRVFFYLSGLAYLFLWVFSSKDLHRYKARFWLDWNLSLFRSRKKELKRQENY